MPRILKKNPTKCMPCRATILVAILYFCTSIASAQTSPAKTVHFFAEPDHSDSVSCKVWTYKDSHSQPNQFPGSRYSFPVRYGEYNWIECRPDEVGIFNVATSVSPDWQPVYLPVKDLNLYHRLKEFKKSWQARRPTGVFPNPGTGRTSITSRKERTGI